MTRAPGLFLLHWQETGRMRVAGIDTETQTVFSIKVLSAPVSYSDPESVFTGPAKGSEVHPHHRLMDLVPLSGHQVISKP